MITAIVGTNRRGSRSAAVADALAPVYADLGERLERIDLSELPTGLFDPSAYANKPPEFAPFVEKVLGARGLIVITPEYNGGPPGALKYFIDMLPFPQSFERRPVCFIGLSAGMWGALRAVEQLQGILGYRDAFIYPERVFIPRCTEAFDERGCLRDSDIAARLAQQAMGFTKFLKALGRA